MVFLDWVPTPVEVFDWVACHLTDHEYEENDDGKLVCTSCGKLKT